MSDSHDFGVVRRLPVRQAVSVLGGIFLVEWVARMLFWSIAYLRGHIISEGGAGLFQFLVIPLFTLFDTVLEQPLLIQYHTRHMIMTSPYYLVYLGAVSYTISLIAVGILVYKWGFNGGSIRD